MDDRGGMGVRAPVVGAIKSTCDAVGSENVIVAAAESIAAAADDDDDDAVKVCDESSGATVLRTNSRLKNSTQGTTPVADTTKSQPSTVPEDVLT